MRTRTWVDGNVWDFQALDTNVVYVVSILDGTLWREFGTMHERNQVDANLLGFAPGQTNNQPPSFTANVNLTFSDLTPVGGWSTLQLSKDGSYVFSGHLHDSGFVGFNVGIAWAVRDNTGTVYTFGTNGSVQGTIDNPLVPEPQLGFHADRDERRTCGSVPNLPSPGQSWRYEVTASLDLVALIEEVVSDVETIIGVVAQVIAIVG